MDLIKSILGCSLALCIPIITIAEESNAIRLINKPIFNMCVTPDTPFSVLYQCGDDIVYGYNVPLSTHNGSIFHDNASVQYNSGMLCGNSRYVNDAGLTQASYELSDRNSITLGLLDYQQGGLSVRQNGDSNGYASTPTICTRKSITERDTYYMAAFPPVLKETGIAGDNWAPINPQIHPNRAAEVTCRGTETYGICYQKALVRYNIIIGSIITTPPPLASNIFDGAGSIIEPNTDCYGCDKDIAVMHPHSNANSTVVFQWLHDQGKCDNLVLTAEEPLSVEIKSKGWNTPIIQSAFKSQISATSSLRLYKQDDWTTIAVTSSEPIHNAIQITAKCALPVSGDRLPGPTKETIEKIPVIFSDGANWMGTGSLISTANRGAGDAAQYGILQDLAIGSNNSNAVTSFQWLSSDRCASLRLEDGSISEISRQAKVSIKLWDDATFSQLACNSLPCDIAAYADNTTYNYYVLKVESNTGSLPSDIRAVCQ